MSIVLSTLAFGCTPKKVHLLSGFQLEFGAKSKLSFIWFNFVDFRFWLNTNHISKVYRVRFPTLLPLSMEGSLRPLPGFKVDEIESFLVVDIIYFVLNDMSFTG